MANVKVNRKYGKERAMGDIFYNQNDKSVFIILNAGFLGQTTLTLQKQQDGTFDVLKPYMDKLGQTQVARLGKLFPAKDKAGQTVEGITKGTFGLFREYDKETKKSLTSSRDCLILTTHRLQANVPVGDNGLLKIGYVTGQYAIETDEYPQASQQSAAPQEEYPQNYEEDGEEIPF